MKSEQESEQYSYTCKLCGDSYQHKKKKQSRTQCTSCKERQDWGNAATEPKWWPRFIPTKDNGRSKNIRWTNYALLSFFLGILVLMGAAVKPIQDAMGYTPPPKRVEIGEEIPNVVGMNLQDAQDCLQEYGFTNTGSESLGKGKQWLDASWLVTKQTKVGPTDDRFEKIILYVERLGGQKTRWMCLAYGDE